ncbi:MAG: NAD(P)-dependent oxidoreductase [Bacteroidota bacterium]
MSDKKQVVLLTGASGSMGFEAFKLLWEKRKSYDIVLLLRPSKKNRRKFRNYERQAVRERGLRIVWGDALKRSDVEEACEGIDWCLHPMALIPPEAYRNPEWAEKVNTRATQYIVEAIEARDPDHIKMIYIGSVAEYGDRLPPVHVSRCGDPLLPVKYDRYAISKIRGELAVMQSGIRYRVSLRQTFIMIPDLFSLKDPIMFHQPIHSHMETITARDSGRLLVNCLEVGEDSDFWGGYYNISGGPGCRTTYLEFLDRIYSLLGIDYRKVMDRNWFALKNFHMQFFEDADRLNGYLNHWEGGMNLEDYYTEVWKKFPWYLKVTAWYNRYVPPYKWFVQAITRAQLKKLARKEDGTLGWIRNKEAGKIHAYFGSMEKWSSIPGWDAQMPSLEYDRDFSRLDHGYDEAKKQLELEDLRQAAIFRGGILVSDDWDRDMNKPLRWKCCQGHTFEMTPHVVLKGGHWCIECISPPWKYEVLAEKNPFAAQVLRPDTK